MKKEIFKLNYELYNVVVHHDHNPISSSPLKITKMTDNDHEVGDLEEFLFLYNEVSVSQKKKSRYVDSHIFIEKFSSELQQEYIEHYGNPLAKVSKKYSMILVEKNLDKVSIKLFYGLRSRRVGKHWFKTSKNMEFITVNTKTGDFYRGSLLNYQSKKNCKKKICKNFFVDEPINSFMITIRNCVWSYVLDHSSITREAMSKFLQEIDGRGDFDELSFEQRMFKFYLDKKGVKYPNNFFIYSKKFFGPQFRKELKKNDNRLVDTIMSLNNLSGKTIKKALHTCNNLNIDLYYKTKKLFGEDWINQDENFVLKTLNSEIVIGSRAIPAEFLDLISKEELRRVFKVFKKVFFENRMNSYTFLDHITFYTELKMYGENEVKWMSDDSESMNFMNEHRDWSDKISYYKNGFYNRIYPEYTYEELEKPIGDYYPVVLNNSSNYNNESSTQSNCVKTYIGKAPSMIISLRKGSQFSDERATIEYIIFEKEDKRQVQRVQSLGRFNSKLSDDWISKLLKLDLRMLYYVNDKRFESVKITKDCPNGTILESDSYFNEEGTLKWTYKSIEGVPSAIFQWI